MKKITIILLMLCAYTAKAQIEGPQYSVKSIAANTILSNFGTTFYGEDKLVFASPTKRNYIISNVWKGNNQPYLDLYIGTITNDGGLKDVEKFSKVINTTFHEADVTFSKDKKTVYFTRSNYFGGKYRKDSLGINRVQMFKATQDASGQWSEIYDMPFNNDNYSVGHPTLSEDGKTLYFISDMPGTLGKTDIFKVEVFDDGTYGKPINLGPEINTPEKEMFPYIAGNDELYFSSEGRGGLGMLDIFMSKLNENGVEFTIHLDEPLNSEKDDFGFIINNETREGYFSSNRYDGKGDDDIYYFKEDKPVVIICNQSVKGVVKDKDTKLFLPGTSISLYKDNVKIDSLITTGTDAKFEFPLECESSYKIVGTKENYLEGLILLNTTDENEKVHNVVLSLNQDDEFLVVGDRVLLKINTIYFDFDRSEIREDAGNELMKAIQIMEKYPDLIVEFGAHCDSRGPDAYNDKLSAKRASSTVNYMFERGISRDRLTGKGYGEKMLTNKCANGVKCTEEEHQMNRRTEFVIKNPEVISRQ
ncbi:OmpA family protein [Lutibacter sp. B1]|uniref:OmpA family protein n=1 Tax=Lutibacter sp. B1 TaxID=2725996 RepID=UPI0014573BFD|nr:OmpA family protein [Lutibacter sp. B1]NLP58379.1 OmpA family protein [Lutibacter sp. B1]